MSTIEEQYQAALAKHNRKNNSGWVGLRIFILLCIFAGASVGVSQYILGVYTVPTASMLPTILPGDKILMNKLYPDNFGIARGDIIVFEDPGTWLSAAEKGSGNTLVKRVIAVGGDHIECCDPSNNLVLNGVSVLEPYIDGRDHPSSSKFDEIVPEGYFFVMGDNRSDSNDSRYNDDTTGGKFIALEKIKGKAFWTLSPESKELQ